MRRTLTLVVYLAMIPIGLWILGGPLLHGGKVGWAAAGAFLTVFGIYLLWIDFIGPAFGRERE